jgi:anti-sigma regulatory factor (Ser/Thr protein kinase)
VGGDFYDFIDLPDGRLGIVIGDVTDKGVPAALVMAATRSVLRASAQRLIEPGAVLERVNEHLCPDIPENMFVTCLYGVLEPDSGRLVFANAGHNLPLVALDGVTSELRARGMPLGLMPGMDYEETEAHLQPGAQLLLYSDGITEAHDPDREMFGGPRLGDAMAAAGDGDGGRLISNLLERLRAFTGAAAEQEDDITLVAIRRMPIAAELADFTLESAPGNEREAIARLELVLAGEELEPARLERLKTAVAEATMNAMEHGNGFDPDLQVRLTVLASAAEVRVRISDHGHGQGDLREAPRPNLDAKLAGQQTPRGWGLFLIRNMVDELHEHGDDDSHTVELVLHRDARRQ